MRLTSLFPLVVLPTLMMENENTIFPKMNFSQYFARQYFTQAFFLDVFGVFLHTMKDFFSKTKSLAPTCYLTQKGVNCIKLVLPITIFFFVIKDFLNVQRYSLAIPFCVSILLTIFRYLIIFGHFGIFSCICIY